jgi:cytochrome c5
MTAFKSFPARGRTIIGALFIGGLAACLCAAEPQAGASAPTHSVAASASATNAVPPAVKAQLTGAELYSIHCNRCHPERYPTERTAAQWKTIMLHMQVRANLPVKQSRLILQYLQENSGR